MSEKVVRLGTRGSALALAQSGMVARMLETAAAAQGLDWRAGYRANSGRHFARGTKPAWGRWSVCCPTAHSPA